MTGWSNKLVLYIYTGGVECITTLINISCEQFKLLQSARMLISFYLDSFTYMHINKQLDCQIIHNIYIYCF